MAVKVLFIGTPYMNLYREIISEMRRQGYEVDFHAEGNYLEDPLNRRGYRGIKKKIFVRAEEFSKQMGEYWSNVLNTPPFDRVYDYLFVLDGQSLHPCIFEILRKRNLKLKSVNYLFDTTKGVYQFNENFKYFDKVVTFDREESEKYGIELLPIFWCQGTMPPKNLYKFFGFGAYKKDRYRLFSLIYEFSKKNNYRSFIKLVGAKTKFFFIKSLIRQIFNIQNDRATWREFNSDIVTNERLELEKFNELLASSEIILDTNAPHQDGLTSRFMQALGNNKKIITTNKSVLLYDFYTSNQIFVVNDVDSLSTNSQFSSFVSEKLNLTDETRSKIALTRIDNWVKSLFDFGI